MPAALAAPWPPPDPATIVVAPRAVCPWPAPSVLPPSAPTPTSELPTAGRRPIVRPLAIALGTAMLALAAFGAWFIAI